VVRLLGPEQQSADGRTWRQVEDERGNQGWVRADLLVETQAPPGR
jgi:SH3-like domain-containing protein